MVKTNAVLAASSKHMKNPVSNNHTTGRKNLKPTRCNRGLNEISPFLHQVQEKIREMCETRHGQDDPMVQNTGVSNATEALFEDKYELRYVHHSPRFIL